MATDSAMTGPGLSRAESRAAVAEQNWKLLRYFNYYRLAVALCVAAIGLFAPVLAPFGSQSPALFRVAALVYAALGGVALWTARRRRPDFETHSAVLAFADITLLTLLTHASGGISSGLSLLLVVAVAGNSLMLDRRIAVFFASLATVAALLEYSWGLLTDGTVRLDELSHDYPQVGMLGIALFATAFLGYTLAERLRATEKLAEHRGVDLANLAQMNEVIIQRMQMGVLACDADGHIRLINAAARKYLGLSSPPGGALALNETSPDLAIQLHKWLGEDRAQRSRRMFTTRAGYTVLPRFVTLGEDRDIGSLIFLEDMAMLRQQAQQLKLAALARLTASIAHEIRNPLGAIANAAQLLGETVQGNDEEKRLAEIIAEQGRRMNVIVENVTQLSRRDKVCPVKFALGPWLGEFAAQYAQATRTSREALTATGTGDIAVCVDPDQLFQVVGNLCQNALRHSPPFTGMPLIKLQHGKDGDNRPYLDVIDWGTGVPPEIVDHIFDPFFTTTPKGTGLGLYIARELCEGNGATLQYHPGEGGVGSRFRVSFGRPEECVDLGS